MVLFIDAQWEGDARHKGRFGTNDDAFVEVHEDEKRGCEHQEGPQPRADGPTVLHGKAEQA